MFFTGVWRLVDVDFIATYWSGVLVWTFGIIFAILRVRRYFGKQRFCGKTSVCRLTHVDRTCVCCAVDLLNEIINMLKLAPSKFVTLKDKYVDTFLFCPNKLSFVAFPRTSWSLWRYPLEIKYLLLGITALQHLLKQFELWSQIPAIKLPQVHGGDFTPYSNNNNSFTTKHGSCNLAANSQGRREVIHTHTHTGTNLSSCQVSRVDLPPETLWWFPDGLALISNSPRVAL